MITTALPDRLFNFLQTGAPVVLVTVGTDGWGHTAMTWAVAASADRVRLAVDHGSTTLANLERDGKATLQVIGRDNVLAVIKGPARMLRARIDAAPFAIALWELVPADVKDQTWGPVVVSPLVFEWSGPQAEAMRRIEQAVLSEMRAWPG